MKKETLNQGLIERIRNEGGLPIIDSNPNNLNWLEIVSKYELTEAFIREFQNRIPWGLVSIHQSMSESFIEEFQDKIIWTNLIKYQELSEEIFSKFKDKILDQYCFDECCRI
ncbi:hypothetical protein KY334_07075, partial [Candidatus Woesearchaeota archaeon]|nr:hypothetical protein [Candidatus Woesearchaeota archaeon]